MAASTTIEKGELLDGRQVFHFDRRVICSFGMLGNAPVKRRALRKTSTAMAWRMLNDLVAGGAQGQENRCFKDDNGRPWGEISGVRHSASISHSRDLIAVAVGIDPMVSVGIDVEYRDANRPVAEMAHLLGLSPTTPVLDFYDAWCRYEAIFKATGESDPMAQADLPSVALSLPSCFSGSLVTVERQ